MVISSEPTFDQIAASHLLDTETETSTAIEPSDSECDETEDTFRTPVNAADAIRMAEELKFYFNCNGGNVCLLNALDSIERFVLDKR